MVSLNHNLYRACFFFLRLFAAFRARIAFFCARFAPTPWPKNHSFVAHINHSPLASTMLTPNCYIAEPNLDRLWLQHAIPSGIQSLFPAMCLVLVFFHGPTNIQTLTTCQHPAMDHSWLTIETILCQKKWYLHHIWSWRTLSCMKKYCNINI